MRGVEEKRKGEDKMKKTWELDWRLPLEDQQQKDTILLNYCIDDIEAMCKESDTVVQQYNRRLDLYLGLEIL